MRTKSAFGASVWIPIAALALLWALREVVVLVARETLDEQEILKVTGLPSAPALEESRSAATVVLRDGASPVASQPK